MALNYVAQLGGNITNIGLGTPIYGAEALVNTGKMGANILGQTGRKLLHVLNNPGHLFKKSRRAATKDQYKAIMTEYKKEMSEDTATYVAPYKGERPNASFWTKLTAGTIHGATGAIWNGGKTALDTTRRGLATLPVRAVDIFRKKDKRVKLRKNGRTNNMKQRWKKDYIDGFKQLKATPTAPSPTP